MTVLVLAEYMYIGLSAVQVRVNRLLERCQCGKLTGVVNIWRHKIHVTIHDVAAVYVTLCPVVSAIVIANNGH